MLDPISPRTASRALRPIVALSIAWQLGASVALARPAAIPETKSDLDLGAAVTPGGQALSYALMELQQRSQFPLSGQTVEDAWEELEISYRDMDRVTLAAAYAPDIDLAAGDERMYADLSAPYFAVENAFDED